MALTDYTTYDTIRAVMGVSPKELKDATLALALWEQQFLLEMGDVDGGNGQAMAQFKTISALAANARTPQQQQFLDLVNQIAAYSVARQLLSGASLAIPSIITDGKASVTRFDTENFDKVRTGVLGALGQLVRRLKSLLLILVPTAKVIAAPARVFVGTIPIAGDPVTGV